MDSDTPVPEITADEIASLENYAKNCDTRIGTTLWRLLEDRRQLKRHILEMEELIEELHEELHEELLACK